MRLTGTLSLIRVHKHPHFSVLGLLSVSAEHEHTETKKKEKNNDEKKEERGTKRRLGAEGEKGKLSLLKLFNETSCITNQKEEQGEGQRNVRVSKNVGEKCSSKNKWTLRHKETQRLQDFK